ncbi:hypothetical protein HYFRA_00008402 [Hymenoscyphus fraxineus]|uniref:EthD domain-containing protein n=1 Tax=Hymenoscyphus fraxineus TaxID=746836 RepID=A0A9N9PNN5_9HELO|nr:hypothetical protein HYFRA_00008402 [Hymenoscyphus fraxineus]
MNPQGLLKRKPGTTQKEFSDHWYNKHAQLIVPLFLYCKVENYIQIHAPLTTSTSDPSLTLSDWSGAAETQVTPLLLTLLTAPESDSIPRWVVRYYQEVVLVDERRFLDGEAMTHVRMVEGGTVMGERKAVIEGGKVVVGVGEEAYGGYIDLVGEEG